MTTLLKIRVTREILRKSMYCGGVSVIDGIIEKTPSKNCAIALSVRDIFPNAVVGLMTLYFDCNNVLERQELPLSAMEFIKRFDSLRQYPKLRLELPEIEFEIEIPDSVLSKINIDEIRPLLENHPTLELV